MPDATVIPKLLPCPWCGSMNVATRTIDFRAHVFCCHCFARGPRKDTSRSAAEQWNRAPRAVSEAAMTEEITDQADTVANNARQISVDEIKARLDGSLATLRPLIRDGTLVALGKRLLSTRSTTDLSYATRVRLALCVCAVGEMLHLERAVNRQESSGG